MSTREPLEEFMLAANWEPREFLSAASRVEFENTNYLGTAKKYTRFQVPRGGLLFSASDWDLLVEFVMLVSAMV